VPSPTPAELTQLVRSVGLDAGLAAVGVCDARAWSHTRGVLESRRERGLAGTMAFTYRRPARSADPTRILRDARSIVVGAWSYAQAVPEPGVAVAARIARYATADHYHRLESALGAIATELRGAGHRTVVMSDDNSMVDREAAWRAGIGSAGKNANVLLPGAGSWFVLGSVVTDAALATTGPPVADQCGTCRRCLDSCPTDAIVAPGVVDARRCLAWMLQAPGEFPREHRVALGDRLYGCDDCQEVCPPNRRADQRRDELGRLATEDDPGSFVDAVAMLACSDDELLTRFGRWYLPDRDPGVLRRNLLVIVGNRGRGDDAEVVTALASHLRHPDDVVASHAAWAAIRLGRRDLLEEVDVADRPCVAAEIAAETEAGLWPEVATASGPGEDDRS
jgi:epoxyqueuosine reductase